MMALTIAVVVMSFCGFLFFFIGLIWLIGCAALCHTYRSARNSVNEEGSVTNTDSLPFYGVRVERPVENEGSYAGTVKINSSDTLEMLVLSRRDNPTSGELSLC